jgi:hypothetical protein
MKPRFLGNTARAGACPTRRVVIAPKRRRPAPPPEKPTPEQAQIQAQIDTARDNNAAITAPDELKRPHRAIAGWLAEHKRQVQDRLPPIEIAIGSASNRNQTYFRK